MVQFLQDSVNIEDQQPLSMREMLKTIVTT